MQSDLAVGCCTLVLNVPLRPVTARQWALLTSRAHQDTYSYDLEIEDTARTIARAFRSAASTEYQQARLSGYEAWDMSALVTFSGTRGEVTVVVLL
jgi:hypothetical protein